MKWSAIVEPGESGPLEVWESGVVGDKVFFPTLIREISHADKGDFPR